MRSLLVSVVMITYNHEKYIFEAIKGVFQQECDFNIELIIADDHSSDSTGSIVENMISKAPPNIAIKYFRHKVNKGVIPNFVWALNQSKGEYIALCEGDDYWINSSKLQKQVDFLEAHPDYLISAGQSMYIGFNNKLYSRKLSLTGKEYFTVEDYIRKMLFETATIVFKNSPPVSIPVWFSRIFSGDQALVMWITKDGGRIHIMNEFLAVYRYHSQGVTKLKTSDFKIQKFFELLDYFDSSTDWKFKKAIEERKLIELFTRKYILLPYPLRVFRLIENTSMAFRLRKQIPITFRMLAHYLLPIKEFRNFMK